jgi:hypothetical protein
MARRPKCINVKISPEHHAALVQAADREQVSLNAYCSFILALALSVDLDDGWDDLFLMEGDECQLQTT